MKLAILRDREKNQFSQWAKMTQSHPLRRGRALMCFCMWSHFDTFTPHFKESRTTGKRILTYTKLWSPHVVPYDFLYYDFLYSHPIMISGVVIQWAEQWLYLGARSIIDREKKKFYRCTNSIFRIDRHSNNMVMLRLVEPHCVPILSYTIEFRNISNRDELRQLHVAYNSLWNAPLGKN